MASLAGEHAEAVRPDRRFHIDFPTGAGARQRRRVVCPPDRHYQRRFPFRGSRAITKPDEFREACRRAATAAANGRIVTFGIEPTHPATNYGYIRPGKRLNGTSVLAVEAFVEKPDALTAANYVPIVTSGTAAISCSCRDHAG
jgi:hypothetical protein